MNDKVIRNKKTKFKAYQIYNYYKNSVGDIDGLSMSEVPDFADNNHWLSILQVDSHIYGEVIELLIKRLENRYSYRKFI